MLHTLLNHLVRNMQRILFLLIIFCSAFLLFQIQPILSKELLPLFGGGASVWSASMVFYQGMLLVGYLYAHTLSRFQLKQQLIIHIMLVLISVPITFSEFALPEFIILAPVWSVIIKLMSQVGLVFLLLSSTSVLMQRWYIETTHKSIPYHWYSLSNFGSLLALISYPFVFEVFFFINEQKNYWLAGLCSLTLLLLALIFTIFKSKNLDCSATQPRLKPMLKSQKLSHIKYLWITLSACSTVMLIATTQMISTNIPPMPLIWTLPLAIYLITFSFAFASENSYRRAHWSPLVPFAVFAGLMMFFVGSQFDALAQFLMYALVLFICCMVCHGELRRSAPTEEGLTQFYLCIAFGGAIGSVFSALLAPMLFSQITEYILAISGIFSLFIYIQHSTAQVRSYRYNAGWAISIIIWGLCYFYLDNNFNQYNLASERNFYGYITVKDIVNGNIAERRLVDGTTIHGSQSLVKQGEQTGTYYHQDTGVIKSLNTLKQQGNLNIGIIGLGAGVLAKFADKADKMRFYELNPAVYNMATKYFSYLSEARSDIEIILGDGRMTLAQEVQDGNALMNGLVIDAFSSDVIPAHLLTQEAFALYWRRMVQDGVLIIHISNNHIDLMPVLHAHSSQFNKSLVKFKYEGNRVTAPSSVWVAITSNQQFLDSIAPDNLPSQTFPKEDYVIWTDQKNSLLPLLKL
jgi:spermidine synthase